MRYLECFMNNMVNPDIVYKSFVTTFNVVFYIIMPCEERQARIECGRFVTKYFRYMLQMIEKWYRCVVI